MYFKIVFYIINFSPDKVIIIKRIEIMLQRGVSRYRYHSLATMYLVKLQRNTEEHFILFVENYI